MSQQGEVLYFNSLATGRMAEVELARLDVLEKAGFSVTLARINWQTDESFEAVLDMSTQQAKEIAQAAGSLTLIGCSAGGSFALNVLGNLKDYPSRAVNIAGRLHRGSNAWHNYRRLDRSAHLATRKASKLFYDSVEYCEDVTIPHLTENDKQRIFILKPRSDFVVPVPTMDIEGVEAIRINAFNHLSAATRGLRMLPKLLISEAAK